MSGAPVKPCTHGPTARTGKQRRLLAALLRAEDRNDWPRTLQLERAWRALALRRGYRHVPSCAMCTELVRLLREEAALPLEEQQARREAARKAARDHVLAVTRRHALTQLVRVLDAYARSTW
jgi:hypothetical protein